MNRNKIRGFTLIEVLVALGIAGGSLILMLSACRASLRRTQRASENNRLELLVQSKLDEFRAGAETATHGIFLELAGAEWNVTVEPAEVTAVKELKRITLRVKKPGESSVREFSMLQYVKKVEPK